MNQAGVIGKRAVGLGSARNLQPYCCRCSRSHCLGAILPLAGSEKLTHLVTALEVFLLEEIPVRQLLLK